MDIVEFFDPKKLSHRQAFDHLNEQGEWPQEFVDTWPSPRLDFPPSWILSLTHQMYIYYRGRTVFFENKIRDLQAAIESDT